MQIGVELGQILYCYQGKKIANGLPYLNNIFQELRNDDFNFYYSGIWELKNNKLFLIGVDSDNENIKHVLNISEPLFLDWFNGEVTFPVTSENEIFLSIRFKDGFSLERNIVLNSFIDRSIFTFGKYEGYRVCDVIRGTLNGYDLGLFEEYDDDGSVYVRKSSWYLEEESNRIYRYLKELISFFIKKDYEKSIYLPDLKIEVPERELIDFYKRNGITLFLTGSYLAIRKNGPFDYDEHISIFFERVLNSDFTKLKLHKKSELDENIVKESVLLNSDVDYIEWCIKNLNHFTVLPSMMVNPGNSYRFLKFETKRLNNSIFSFKPVYGKIEIIFKSETIELNANKYLKRYNILYNSDLKCNVFDNSNPKIIKKFGSFLKDEPQDELKANTRDKYNSGYGKYHGSYAQEIEGLSDNYIDDVLDGDPEAYWNID